MSTDLYSSIIHIFMEKWNYFFSLFFILHSNSAKGFLTWRSRDAAAFALHGKMLRKTSGIIPVTFFRFMIEYSYNKLFTICPKGWYKYEIFFYQTIFLQIDSHFHPCNRYAGKFFCLFPGKRYRTFRKWCAGCHCTYERVFFWSFRFGQFFCQWRLSPFLSLHDRIYRDTIR